MTLTQERAEEIARRIQAELYDHGSLDFHDHEPDVTLMARILLEETGPAKQLAASADVEDPHPSGCHFCGRDLAEAPFTIQDIDGVPVNAHTHCLDNQREGGEIIKKLDEVGDAWDPPTEKGERRDTDPDA